MTGCEKSVFSIEAGLAYIINHADWLWWYSKLAMHWTIEVQNDRQWWLMRRVLVEARIEHHASIMCG